jgi:hypothetical protein
VIAGATLRLLVRRELGDAFFRRHLIGLLRSETRIENSRSNSISELDPSSSLRTITSATTNTATARKAPSAHQRDCCLVALHDRHYLAPRDVYGGP